MAVQGAVRGMATELQASVLDSAARRAMAAMVFRVVMAADTPEAMALRDMVVIREDMAIRNTQTAVSRVTTTAAHRRPAARRHRALRHQQR